MKSCLLMLIVLGIVLAFAGTAAIVYFASSEVEAEAL